MHAVNRYQLVFGAALLIFVLGLVRAGAIFFGSSGADLTRELSFSSSTQAPLLLPRSFSLPRVAASVKRNPFVAASQWREPEPEVLPPPPLEDLLRLVPSPFLLCPDGAPRLIRIPRTSEKRVDRTLLLKVKTLFRKKSEGTTGGVR